MISAEQKPVCPVCRKSDKVLKLQTAYNQGVARLAPPPMPSETITMSRFVGAGMLLVGLCIFLILILVGSESFGQGFSFAELVLVSLTIICIVLALSLSFVAFRRIVVGDRNMEKLYPKWDSAIAQYNRLRYCVRDDTVFDPQTGKAISGDAFSALIAVQAQAGADASATSLAH